MQTPMHAADQAPSQAADPLNQQGTSPLHSGQEEENAELLLKVNQPSEIAHHNNTKMEDSRKSDLNK